MYRPEEKRLRCRHSTFGARHRLSCLVASRGALHLGQRHMFSLPSFSSRVYACSTSSSRSEPPSVTFSTAQLECSSKDAADSGSTALAHDSGHSRTSACVSLIVGAPDSSSSGKGVPRSPPLRAHSISLPSDAHASSDICASAWAPTAATPSTSMASSAGAPPCCPGRPAAAHESALSTACRASRATDALVRPSADKHINSG
mmetsp:Transcript_6409/g.25933  ORF Transcript_6409/g.25933 Transcript_6409/m.25933 type:complete len:202 (-) Transcript_6409:1816-2421(-)